MKVVYKVLLILSFIVLLLLVVFVSVYFYVNVEPSSPPHIILILADDLGWNDVSMHGASDIPTPNIDALGLNGLLLNSYYGEWLCTPSRGALLTGLYPMRLGLQHHVILAGEASSLPLSVVTLPQHLKKLGYATHIVGKWHLGYQNTENFPTHRGFDTFFGYLNGLIDYYDYTHYWNTTIKNQEEFFGIDLYHGTKLVTDFRGKYATEAFTNHANSIIKKHDTSKPLFLYLSHLAIHIGNENQPLQAPPEITSKFKYIKNETRRIHAAKISALDDSVGSVFQALHQKQMLQNSIVLFMSDNGGQTTVDPVGLSSNYPLRGCKYTAWEGGLRLPAMVWSPLLELSKPVVSSTLMHVTDWLPTLYSAAGGNITDLGKIDGLNTWKSFLERNSSHRTEILNVLDPVLGVSAFRRQQFKLVNGTTGASDSWYGPTSSEYVRTPSSMYEWIFRNGSVVRDILQKEGWWIAEDPDGVYNASKIVCEKNPDARDCKPGEKPCLFNIEEDPCEYHDIAEENPEIVKSMMERITAFGEEQMSPQAKGIDPRADPMCHNFAYVPWLDSEHFTECDYVR